MRSKRKHEGFTLIELLVVMALVGLVVTLIVINIERDTGQLAQLEAERFHALIAHAQDESLLLGRPFAVEVDEATGSYRFLEPGQPWRVISNDDVLRSRRVPSGVELRMDVKQADTNSHLVVVDGLGLITPFVLTVTGGSKQFEVFVDSAQNVRLKTNAKIRQQNRI